VTKDGARILCHDFSAYSLDRVHPDTVRLHIRTAGVLDELDTTATRRRITFFRKAIDSLAVDGEAIATSRIEEVAFRRIFIRGPQSSFSSSRPGVLARTAGRWVVSSLP
jgi:hypothetical protein